MNRAECPHLAAATPASPRAAACESCGMTDALRACLACGHVGCCETHEGHATAHADATGHALIREVSTTNWEGFVWCYACGDYLE